MGRIARAVVVVVLFAAAPMAAGRPVVAGPCWAPPVTGQITDPFRQPDCPYCAGNRGTEYEVAADAPVRVAAAGEVTFAGSVAGVGYVVVRLDSGWRHTYGRIESRLVELGDRVEVGEQVGTASGAFFFGLRIGDDYADPAPWLGELVGRRRLVPTDGAAPRPAPPPTLRCASRSATNVRWQRGGGTRRARVRLDR